MGYVFRCSFWASLQQTLADPFVHGLGAFDIVAELWPHIAMILYRLHPGRHSLMYRLFLATTFVELAGTVFETIIVFWLWGTLWNQWTLPFKIITPVLHALFSAAQLLGAWVFWQMATKEKSTINAIEVELDAPKIGPTVSDEPSRAFEGERGADGATISPVIGQAHDRDAVRRVTFPI